MDGDRTLAGDEAQQREEDPPVRAYRDLRSVLGHRHVGAYQRAAVRWLGRFALEARDVTIEDLRLAAEALDALRDRTTEAMERLQGLCLTHGVG